MKIDLYNVSKAKGYVKLIDSMGDLLTPVNAARVSFGVKKETLDTKDLKLIDYLIKHKHTSPFEHNVVSFEFQVPLFVARQHMRHRTWSFNEISRRYTKKDISFYEPNSFRTQHDTNRQASNDDLVNPVLDVVQGTTVNWETKASSALKRHVKSSLKLYDNMIDAGICKEQARMVLPQNLYTTYIGTCNLSNLIKFIKLRDHEGAQEEIRQVAIACREIVKQLWPEIIEALYKD
tara:strand:- start:747 stop:1448 length:702 start_codon:yes stop_codon:yes gene_type:complete